MPKDASARAKKNIVKKDENGNVKKPSKAAEFFDKIGKGFKAMKSEFKKVTWAKFPDVLKQTGVVLVVTLFFLIVIGCFDLGLSELLKLVTKAG